MINRAILMGRLTADPELRQTPSGTAVCTFTVAVERRFSDRNGERQTDFLDVVAWKGTAEFVSQYFSKGKMIIVEGSVQTRSYEDRNGNKRRAVEVVADNVQFGESKSAGGSQQGYTAPAPTQAPPEPAVSYASGDVGDFSEMSSDSDDLPF